MDEKLEQVLHKVELLCEQNPEFADKLRGKLSIVQHMNTVASRETIIQDSFALFITFSLSILLFLGLVHITILRRPIRVVPCTIRRVV